MTLGGYVNLITIFRCKCKSGVYLVVYILYCIWDDILRCSTKVFEPHCPPPSPHLTPGVAKLNWAIAWPGISVLEDRIRHCWLSLRLAPSSSDSSGQTTRILAPILVHVTRCHSHSRSGQSGVSVLHNTHHHPPPPSTTSILATTHGRTRHNWRSEERKLRV